MRRMALAVRRFSVAIGCGLCYNEAERKLRRYAFESLEIFAADAEGELGELLCEAETY